MQFVKNSGQTDKEVEFLSRGPGYAVFLTPTEAVFSLTSLRDSLDKRSQDRHRAHDAEHRIVRHADLHMKLIGANPRPVLESIDQLPGTANYILGNDPANWHLNVPTFSKVKYHDVYPGISLIYYGNQKQLEYDFVTAPNADPGQITLSFGGADKLEIAAEGDLIIHLDGGSVRWHKPIAYQTIDGTRQDVAARFILKQKHEVGFEVASYDHTQSLVIDPVLTYVTYLGGSGDDYACGIALDPSGNVYVAGNTSSGNFPTLNAYRSALVGGLDAFITKINSAGTALLYSTYLGGGGTEVVQGLAVDSSGNAYVTGNTDSLNFPTKNAFASANSGFFEAFIAKIGPAGNTLVYGSYLGGNGDDFGNCIAVDNNGGAYIGGYTYSIGTGNGPFPVAPGNNAYQRNNNGGRDAFVAKFDTTQTGSASLIYSTFLGGQSYEKAYGIAVDSGGNAVVVGEVYSSPDYPTPPFSDFPLVNAYQSSFNRGNLDPIFAGNRDGFVTKINAAGTDLIFSTFLGGGSDDSATGVTLDSSGRIYVVGETSSTNFPVTANAVQPAINSDIPDFAPPDFSVTVFQSNGLSLYYSTYLGGTDFESSATEGYHAGIGIDRFGNIYITGQTTSFDFPITGGADDVDPEGNTDAFVAKINPAVPGPPGLIYSSLLGGDDLDRATGIAVTSNGTFYVVGFSSSVTNLATSGIYRTTNSGGIDTFIAKYASSPDLSVSMIPSIEPVTVGSNLTYTIQVNNNGFTSFTGVTNIIQFSRNVSLLAVSSSAGNWRTNSTTNGTQLSFNIGTLTNNASVAQSITFFASTNALLMTNIATVSSFETASLEANKSNNVATVLTTIRGITDLRLLTTTSTPEPVPFSSNLTYTIVVNNKGSSYAATAVELVSVLPDGVNLVSATNNLGTFVDFGSGVLVFDFNPIPTNGNATVTIVATAMTNGTVVNQLSVSGLELDTVPANNTGSIVSTITPLANVSIGQTGPSAGYLGNNFSYTLKVTNAGPSAATSVVVTDVLPPNVSYVNGSNPLGTISQNNGVVTCTISSLASNATGTITVTVQPVTAGNATNSVSITSAGFDPVMANNSASLVTLLAEAADLAISQSAVPNSTEVTSNITFTITITNRGPSTASAVTVTDPVPAGLEIISIQSPGASSAQANGVITCNFGSMANGASSTITVTVQAVTDGVYTNTATVASSTTDLNPANTASSIVTVSPNPNAPLLKIARSGTTNVVLSWATNAVGFVLQSRTNLILGSWSPVTNSPTRIGNLWNVTNSITGSTKYYRLTRTLPVLSAIKQGNQIVVSWPGYATGGILKSTPSLTAPITWNNAGTTPVLAGGTFYVTNPIADRAFFQLFY